MQTLKRALLYTKSAQESQPVFTPLDAKEAKEQSIKTTTNPKKTKVKTMISRKRESKKNFSFSYRSEISNHDRSK